MSRIKVRESVKRTTLDLDDIDLANIDSIKESKGFATMSETIRYALNVTGRTCRRETLEYKIEIEALRQMKERRVEYG